MAKKLQLRRGTTSQHSSFTGAVGEVTVDTDKKTVVVHDGSTAGGTPLQKEDADLTALSGCQSGAAGAIAALLQAEVEILDGATVTTAELNTLDGFTGDKDDLIYAKDLKATGVTAVEFDYLDGVTSAIQTQINAKGDAVLATDFQQWAGTQRAAVKAVGSTANFNIELDQGNLFTISLSGASTLTFKKNSSTALNADCIGVSGTIFLTNSGANAQAMASHCKKASGVEIPATAGDYIIPFTVIAADKVLVDVIGPVT